MVLEMKGTAKGGRSLLESTSELVAQIYRTAAEPNAYDDFMDRWAAYLAARERTVESLELNGAGKPPKDGTKEGIDEAVLRHFSIGFQLLGQLGRNSASKPGTELDESGPSLLIDGGGRIVWYNGSAAGAFGLTSGSTVQTLVMSPSSQEALKRALAALNSGDGTTLPTTVVQLSSDHGSTTLMEVSAVGDEAGRTAILVRELRPGWRRELSEILKADLGLTPSEIDVVRFLAEGQTLQEISSIKSNSVETIRGHVKSILSKTGARNQAELVRLTMTLLRHVERLAKERPHRGQAATQTLELCVGGRTIPVDMFGAPNGRPVIFFHGMLDGCRITKRLNTIFEERGIRLIAPFRPSFGTAAAAEYPVEEAPERFASDVEALVAELKLEEIVLLGHLAGSIYAFATAARLGCRVKAIVNVGGGVPIVSTAQFRQMSVRQRLVAWTARNAPSLLPFLIRAGMRQLDFGGQEQFAVALYKNSKADQTLLLDQEVYGIVTRGFQLSVTQGHKAFQTDAWHVVRDWSHLVKRSTAPVELIHGENDPVVGIRSVRDFAARHSDRISVTSVPECGQLVLHAAPELIAGAIDRAFEVLAHPADA